MLSMRKGYLQIDEALNLFLTARAPSGKNPKNPLGIALAFRYSNNATNSQANEQAEEEIYRIKLVINNLIQFFRNEFYVKSFGKKTLKYCRFHSTHANC